LRGIHGDELPGGHLVAAYAHAAGAVLGQAPSAGKGHELAAAEAVAAEAVAAAVPLAGRVVTGDALLTQRDLGVQIVTGGGDSLLPVKDNQPALRADLEAALSPAGAERRGRGRAAPGAVLAARRAAGAGGRAERGDGR
jgi:hypothetical protein